jgi:transcriptional regulator with XRE-family HTH domain
LGERIGVAFQQVQKYEKAGNRVSCSRLSQIARILDVPVTYFFSEVGGVDSAGDSGLADLLADDHAIHLLLAFAAISNPRQRAAVVDLVKTFQSSVAAAGAEVDHTQPQPANGASAPVALPRPPSPQVLDRGGGRR